jgi:hypothetical protein
LQKTLRTRRFHTIVERSRLLKTCETVCLTAGWGDLTLPTFHHNRGDKIYTSRHMALQAAVALLRSGSCVWQAKDGAINFAGTILN